MRDRATNGLTDVPGIRVGHASDYEGITGCTAILCESGAVAGADIRGSATGTEEFDLFNPLHLTERIHAVTLAGGSAFGLEAASGVRRFLEHKGIGFPAGVANVPLVPAAILFDLGIGKASARPTREMGEAAAAAATANAVAEGSVGAGTGATVGKLLGMKHAVKAGIGSCSRSLPGGLVVAALAAVNAFGDVLDPRTGAIVAGARRSETGFDFINTAAEMLKGEAGRGFHPSNTTLVVIATNARLNKAQATKLAQLASLGVARTISPVWTTFDGDVVIALSLGNLTADLNALGVAAAEVVSESILRSVGTARSLGGVPAIGK
ncbi:MAG: P1 family peptidase [Acidobacteria bacterium]|nr:P1 family peptidase [Acidobacteriota bacterium]